MGFRRSPPPFLSVASKIGHQSMKGLKGVNFASGGSGILDSTVSIKPNRHSTTILSFTSFYFATLTRNHLFSYKWIFQGSSITMTEQIQLFATVRSNLSVRVSTGETNLLLSKSIFLISTGGNDIFGYFSQNKSPNDIEKQQFITTLISVYKGHLKVTSLSHTFSLCRCKLFERFNQKYFI